MIIKSESDVPGFELGIYKNCWISIIEDNYKIYQNDCWVKLCCNCYQVTTHSRLVFKKIMFWGNVHTHTHTFHSVVSDSLWPHESQHARPPCPSPTPGAHSNSRPSSQWCHPAIWSPVVPFSSCRFNSGWHQYYNYKFVHVESYAFTFIFLSQCFRSLL